MAQSRSGYPTYTSPLTQNNKSKFFDRRENHKPQTQPKKTFFKKNTSAAKANKKIKSSTAPSTAGSRP